MKSHWGVPCWENRFVSCVRAFSKLRNVMTHKGTVWLNWRPHKRTTMTQTASLALRRSKTFIGIMVSGITRRRGADNPVLLSLWEQRKTKHVSVWDTEAVTHTHTYAQRKVIVHTWTEVAFFLIELGEKKNSYSFSLELWMLNCLPLIILSWRFVWMK